ncbi:MAG: DUF2029 domain-containing protein [Candidatus Hydrogenedentes bacterium]|nr:DUF2029 domain-containing protein [Candidatus Hydrogenedentota bacterium]
MVFLALAISALFYVGFLKNRGALVEDYDATFWYIAGQCWLEGVSPYDHDIFLEHYWKAAFGKHEHGDEFAFAYPSTLSVIALPMALFDWDWARHGYRTISFIAFCSVCVFLVSMLRDGNQGEQNRKIPWGYLGFSALLYPVSITLHQGQTSLVVLWGMVAALYGCHRQKTFWTVVGVVFACIKPQMSLPFLVYILFRGGIRQVAAGVFVSALLALGVVIPTVTPDFMAKCAESLAIHRSRWENAWFFYDSLPSLLGDTPLGGLAALAGVGIACAAAFWLARGGSKVPQAQSAVGVRHFQIICALTLAMMPLHRYDAVLYVPVVATLPLLRTLWQRILVLGLILFHGRIWFLLARLYGYKASWSPGTVGVSIMGGVILGLLVHYFVRDSRRDSQSPELSLS